MFIGPVFFVPAIASATLLAVAWISGLLSRPVLYLVWFVVALVGQFGALPYSPRWAVAIALQAALAVRLAILRKLDT